MVQLTRALAVEYIKTSLRVNAIAPAGPQRRHPIEVRSPPDMDLDLAVRMARRCAAWLSQKRWLPCSPSWPPTRRAL